MDPVEWLPGHWKAGRGGSFEQAQGSFQGVGYLLYLHGDDSFID